MKAEPRDLPAKNGSSRPQYWAAQFAADFIFQRAGSQRIRRGLAAMAARDYVLGMAICAIAKGGRAVSSAATISTNFLIGSLEGAGRSCSALIADAA